MTRRRHEEPVRDRSARREAHGTERLPRVALRTPRRQHHGWVYRRMLGGPYLDLEPGSLVEAVGQDGAFVGRGFYNPHSEIALRILTEEPGEAIDAAWFQGALARAVDLRHRVLKLNKRHDAYRLVHSEGDGLSGLVVDRLAGVLVLELFSAGMHKHRAWVEAGLRAHFPNAKFVVRADRRSERHEGVQMEDPDRDQGAREVVIQEGGARFHVDLRQGHKTGFFMDQRENRAGMAELCGGEDLFDGCCYTGGFSIAAARAGARTIEAVDLDEDALAVAERNRALNTLDPERLRFIHGDVYNALRAHRAAGRTFSRLVLDPPKMALSRQELPKALRAYTDMNRLGMQCLKDGGMLLSCSCTGLVGEAEFLEALREAACEAHAELQILRVTGAPPDHPWSVHVPEGRYLKAVFARVKARPQRA